MTVLAVETPRPEILDVRTVTLATKKLIPVEFMTLLVKLAGLTGAHLASHYKNRSPQKVESGLVQARWERTTHPAVNSERYGLYKTYDIEEGVYGMSELETIHRVVVKLEDRRNTGYLTPTIFGVAGLPTKLSMLITETLHGEEVIRTFFPGEPVNRPHVKSTKQLLNVFISAQKAMEMGFTHAMVDEHGLGETVQS